MAEMAIYHSLVKPASLIAWLQGCYALGSIHSCRLIRMGLNDTYAVRSDRAKYIVRLYRACWRSLPEVAAELEVLIWLQTRNFPIAAPIADRHGQYLNHFSAPEGLRAIVVFDFIEGQAMSLDSRQAFGYGQALAKLHTLTDDFHFSKPRFCLDEKHLIDEPLSHIQRAFGHHETEMAQLTAAAAEAAKKVWQSLVHTTASYGFCHGDHFGNVLQTADRELVFIDFDCCGMGFRVYDIVQFCWAIRLQIPAWSETYLESNDSLWDSFLRGYESLRLLSIAEHQALPAMLVIRTIWGLGLQPQNEQHWGIEGMETIWRQNIVLITPATTMGGGKLSSL